MADNKRTEAQVYAVKVRKPNGHETVQWVDATSEDDARAQVAELHAPPPAEQNRGAVDRTEVVSVSAQTGRLTRAARDRATERE